VLKLLNYDLIVTASYWAWQMFYEQLLGTVYKFKVILKKR